MHLPSTLLVLASITAATHAIDLNLWNSGGCRGAKVMCSNPGYAFCCLGGSPFCASGNCDNCVVGNDIYTFNRASCNGASYGSCRAAVGDGCCRSAGGGNTCAIIAYVGNAIARQVKPEECKFTVRPNKMTYTNHNGTEMTIHIPTGEFDNAAKLVVDEDWDALDQFPAWADQKYTESDFVNKKA